MAANFRNREASGGLNFFFWVFGGGGGGRFLCFFCSQCVPPGSQNAPNFTNEFRKTFPITPHFLSHIVWPWFNFHVCNLLLQGRGCDGCQGKCEGARSIQSMLLFFGEENIFRLLCSKNIGNGPINCLLLGRKKKAVGLGFRVYSSLINGSLNEISKPQLYILAI